MSLDQHEPFRLNHLKLAPTMAIKHSIPRENLIAHIRDSTTSLVLVTAPAGFGKTTAMSQVFREMKERGLPVAWLTLDAADNDLARISMYLAAALRDLFAHRVTDANMLSEAAAHFSTANARMYGLLDELPQISAPFSLFLDECEHITDPQVLAFLNRLISLLDLGQRLIVGSRRPPNLHLGKLRVQGRLTELGTEMLRFSEAETRMFVRESMQVEIEDTDLNHLHDQTEGWAAALQLATSANRLGKPGKLALPSALLGSIADYLAEDVLDRLPREQRDFLLKSSIFERFCPSMCDAVFDTGDSEVWIAKTNAENLFINKIDAEGDWYRYHPLFHEFLQRECASVFRLQLQEMHVRAATWLGKAGRTGAGIAHALTANDHELAADLIDQCAMRYVRTGQIKVVRDWVALLSQASLEKRPSLIVAGAYANTYLHRYKEASALIAMLDSVDTKGHDISNDLLLIRVMLATWSDKVSTAFDIAVKSLDELPESDPYVVGIIQNVVAYCHVCHGYLFFYHRAVAAAKRALGSIDALHGLTYSAYLEGSTSLCQADANGLRASATLSFSKFVGQTHSSASPVSVSNLLEAHYEMNDLELVRPLADDYLEMIRDTCIPDQIILAHRVVARMHVLHNQQAKALEILNILQDLGDARGIQRFSASARLDRIWIATLNGDLATVNRLLPLVEAESIWKPFEGIWTFAEDIEDPFIAKCRYAIVSGDVTKTLVQIDGAIRLAESASRRRRVLRLQCLQAQCHEVSRRRQRAVEIMERVLITAQTSGLVRLFADEAWCLSPILEAISLRKSAVSQEYLLKIMEANKIHATPCVDGVSVTEQNADAGLSPRERQILKLLAEGHSNKELAVQVAVAESTIETYLHRINTKLGTRNRTQAVARGRELGVIY